MVSSELEIVARARDQLGDLLPKIQKELDALESHVKSAGGAMDKTSGQASRMSSTLDAVKGAAGRARGGIGGLADALRAATPASMMVLGGLAGLGAAAVSAATKGVMLSASMEQTKIAFETMLGSAQAADAFLRDLWKFAAETPFEFEGLTKASRQLIAFGFKSKDIIPIMKSVGDAVSGLGGGEFEIQRVVRALGQMRAKGKVSAEEMMQLAELGIPAWELLANAIGVSIPKAMDLAEKGAIPAGVAINALVTGMAKRFPDMMKKQSETLIGLFSTMKDNITGILLKLGDEIVKALDLKSKMKDVIAQLQDISRFVDKFGLAGALKRIFPPEITNNIAIIAGSIGGALVPAIYAMAASLLAVMVPLLPFIAAGALLAAAWTQNWGNIQQRTQEAVNNIVPNLKKLGDWLGPNLGAILQVSAVAIGVWAAFVAGQATKTLAQWIGAIAAVMVAHVRLAAMQVGTAALGFARFVANIISATATLGIFVATGIANAIMAVGKLAIALIVTGVAAFNHLALAIMVGAVRGLIYFATGGVVTAIASIRNMVGFIAFAIKYYVVLGTQATWAAVRVAAAWVTTMLPAVIGAIGGMLVALAPFLVGIAAIGVVAAAIALAWANNWGDIQGITAKVLNFIGAKITDFLNLIKRIPGVEGVIDWIGDAVGMAKRELPKLVTTAGDAVGGIVDQFKKAFPEVQKIFMDIPGLKLPEMPGIFGPNKMQSSLADMDDVELAFSRMGKAAKAAKTTVGDVGIGIGETGKKAKEAGISVSDLTSALIATHPATIAAASTTQLWQSRISDVNLALVANKDQIEAAQAAQATLSNTLQGAQSIYQGIQDKLSGLNQLLSESKQRLSELSAPRLAGMGESEKKIAILEAQLKRIQHWKELGFTHPGAALEAMPIDIEGAKEFIATLGGAAFTQEGLSGLIAQFRSLHSIKFDEQLRKLKEAAEDVKPELTFEAAMKGIKDTKTTIGDLTGQIKAQESAMRLQQDAIKGIESAMKSQQGVINDLQLAGEQLNTTLGTYQDELRGAEKQQRLVNEALSDAYKWLLDDKQKMAEMGGEAANQAGVIEAKTRALLTAIDEFAKGTASTIKSNLAEAVQTYKDDVAQILAELAKIELGKGGTFGITPNVRKTPALAAGGIVTRPTLALIGEAGPEAVIPLSRGGGGGGGFVWTGNVIVQGTVVTERELAETVRRELLKVKGRNTSTGL